MKLTDAQRRYWRLNLLLTFGLLALWFGVTFVIGYYANEFNYPFFDVTEPFTPVAQTMLNYLPQEVVSNPVAWMVPVALLILLRVRG